MVLVADGNKQAEALAEGGLEVALAELAGLQASQFLEGIGIGAKEVLDRLRVEVL